MVLDIMSSSSNNVFCTILANYLPSFCIKLQSSTPGLPRIIDGFPYLLQRITTMIVVCCDHYSASLTLTHSLTHSLTKLAFASNRKLNRQKLSIQKCFGGFNMLDFSNNFNSSHNSSTAPWNSSYKKVNTESQNPAHLQQQQQQQHPTISQQQAHHLNLNLPTTTTTTTKEKADL